MNKILVMSAILMTAMFATSVLAVEGQGPLTATAGVYPCDDNSRCSDGTPVCWQGSCQAPMCGISATAINFGNLYPGQTTGEDLSVTSTVSNNGNTPTTGLWIDGTDWVGTVINGANTMPVGQTSWSVGTGWNTLTIGWALTGATINPLSPLTSYFKLSVPLNQANDIYAQTITFDATC